MLKYNDSNLQRQKELQRRLERGKKRGGAKDKADKGDAKEAGAQGMLPCFVCLCSIACCLLGAAAARRVQQQQQLPLLLVLLSLPLLPTRQRSALILRATVSRLWYQATPRT